MADKQVINESKLSKGDIRKLNALRKSLGERIAEKAFLEYLDEREAGSLAGPEDKTAALIQSILDPHIAKIKIPRGGSYNVKRGRGRFIVELAEGS